MVLDWMFTASMFVVGRNAIFTSPFFILSVTKKYCTFRCWVLFWLDVLKFSSSELNLYCLGRLLFEAPVVPVWLENAYINVYCH